MTTTLQATGYLTYCRDKHKTNPIKINHCFLRVKHLPFLFLPVVGILTDEDVAEMSLD
jgi:hypothetical protein